MKCNRKTEVYSRVVGYYRPVQQWNKGKREEYNQRKTYQLSLGVHSELPERIEQAKVEQDKVVQINLNSVG
ncbi:MAG: anaerobic ribonucleoside-triphosphate reductase [Candidatus Alcyoniella australis]|nr:anaerobic ribonucleoside-triphosphate reductase [Candidatus Alcyoniella australis]